MGRGQQKNLGPENVLEARLLTYEAGTAGWDGQESLRSQWGRLENGIDRLNGAVFFGAGSALQVPGGHGVAFRLRRDICFSQGDNFCERAPIRHRHGYWMNGRSENWTRFVSRQASCCAPVPSPLKTGRGVAPTPISLASSRSPVDTVLSPSLPVTARLWLKKKRY